MTDLYTECDGHLLRAPNDLVFDADGGFWFTDHGIRDRAARTSDLTSIHYATTEADIDLLVRRVRETGARLAARRSDS